ncbi:hypothetical protein, partial [Conchiformibius kuhniae]|uniref:hypothetical protein n=1 Tax=Conchiformibius kuhniae TaxID=211502 RepID=UPI001B7FE933
QNIKNSLPQQETSAPQQRKTELYAHKQTLSKGLTGNLGENGIVIVFIWYFVGRFVGFSAVFVRFAIR